MDLSAGSGRSARQVEFRVSINLEHPNRTKGYIILDRQARFGIRIIEPWPGESELLKSNRGADDIRNGPQSKGVGVSDHDAGMWCALRPGI
jgi:hypothetical protein